MLDEKRIDIYDYLYNLFYDVVTKNVYSMNEPQELTKSDTQDGFLVIRAGTINDLSEFKGEAYSMTRVYIEAYVPPIGRGRLDYQKYKEYEDAISYVIEAAKSDNNGTYFIQEGSELSMDATETTNANNLFFVHTKSFIVMTNDEEA